MFSFKKPVIELEENDLADLIGEVSEGQTLDFKRDLNLNTRDERRELAKDVTAMANAQGGSILFGVDEQGAVASSIPGIPVADSEALSQRVTNIILDLVEPRIPTLQQTFVDLANGRKVLIIHIPGRSWLAPHWAAGRFHVRVLRENVPMPYSQLKDDFLGGQRVRERLEGFRADRLSILAADGGPTRLGPGPRIVIHIVPVVGLMGPFEADMATLAKSVRSQDRGEAKLSKYLSPLCYDWDGFFVCQYNVDGLAAHYRRHGDNHESPCYTQFFRNGSLEIADATLLGDNPGRFQYRLLVDSLDRDLWEVDDRKYSRLAGYFIGLNQLGVPPPWILLVSLLGLKGLKAGNRVLNRDALLLPDVMLQDLQAFPSPAVRRLWDIIAQMAGDECWKPSN